MARLAEYAGREQVRPRHRSPFITDATFSHPRARDALSRAGVRRCRALWRRARDRPTRRC